MKVRNKRKLLWIIIASVAAVLIIGSVVAYSMFEASESEADPFTQTEQTTTETEPKEKEVVAETPDPAPEPETPLDPASVSTVDVEPLNITVSYVKGVPGFAFSVSRTQSNTEYVDFHSTELVGTKCTDDEGVFATIIKNPEDADSATISETKTLEGDVYGLSLPESTCTSNIELFEQYQQSFEDAYGLLRLLSAGADEDN